MNTKSEWIEKEDISDIIEKIDGLPAVKRTALKRCCGKLLKDAGSGAAIAFYQVYSLPERFNWTRDRLFAVACMRCLWDVKEEQEKENPEIPFEEVLYLMRRELEKKDSGGWSGMERRLLRLLDRKWSKDGMLCMDIWRMVKQMKSDGHCIDMVSLGLDLCNWNAESKKVQQHWLQVCYQEKREEEQNAD